MGPIKLDKQIVNAMPTWGNNYDSTVGDNHCSVADKIDETIDGKDVTNNIMSKMDASHAKPSNKNPGVDKAFLAKGNPQMGTVGEGRLTVGLQD